MVHAEAKKVLGHVALVKVDVQSFPTVIQARDSKVVVVVTHRCGTLSFIETEIRTNSNSDLNNVEVSLRLVGTHCVNEPGVECFSSIVAYGNMIMFGSRDDCLHILKLQQRTPDP